MIATKKQTTKTKNSITYSFKHGKKHTVIFDDLKAKFEKRLVLRSRDFRMLNVNSNAKTIKNIKVGYLTGVLYLAPSDAAGLINLCPFASKGCRLSCLYTAGRGCMSNVKIARLEKTILFILYPDLFFQLLIKDIRRLVFEAHEEGLKPSLRFNGTSDIDLSTKMIKDGKNLIELFPTILMYDYTKDYRRMYPNHKLQSYKNYHLTFSQSETNHKRVSEVLGGGGNVAMVFDTKKGEPLPESYMGYKVVDGDLHDIRTPKLDGKNAIVGLRAKGDAIKDKSGFVVRLGV